MTGLSPSGFIRRGLLQASLALSMFLFLLACFAWLRGGLHYFDIISYGTPQFSITVSGGPRLFIDSQGITGGEFTQLRGFHWKCFPRNVSLVEADWPIYWTGDNLTSTFTHGKVGHERTWITSLSLSSAQFSWWLIAVVFLIWPASFVLYAVCHRPRPEQDLCYFCGYDLRASVVRCPECGMPFNRNASKSIPVN